MCKNNYDAVTDFTDSTKRQKSIFRESQTVPFFK